MSPEETFLDRGSDNILVTHLKLPEMDAEL